MEIGDACMRIRMNHVIFKFFKEEKLAMIICVSENVLFAEQLARTLELLVRRQTLKIFKHSLFLSRYEGQPHLTSMED